MLDEGRLTDAKGRLVDFKNTIIIMTSNLGSDILVKASSLDDAKKVKMRVMDTVKSAFRPEFINRIDDIVIFHKLDKYNIKDIAALQIASIENRLKDKHIKLSVKESAFMWIVNNGYDTQYGARPLKRLLKTHVENKLALKILSGEIGDNDIAEIVVNNLSLDILKKKK